MTTKPLRIEYSKDGDKWIWTMLYTNGEVAARSPKTYVTRWTARRGALMLVDYCRRDIVEETDPRQNDYPLNKRPKHKPVVGGESDLIDRNK